MKPRAPFAMTFGFILMLLLVCLRPPAIWNYWVDSQPYGTSAALLVAAIAVLSDVHNLAPLQRATRQTIAFAILLLATWVNLSLFLVAGPLFVLLALTLRSSQFATLAVLSLVAYALISLHAALIGGDQYAHFTPSLENVTAASRSRAISFSVWPPHGRTWRRGNGRLVCATAPSRAYTKPIFSVRCERNNTDYFSYWHWTITANMSGFHLMCLLAIFLLPVIK